VQAVADTGSPDTFDRLLSWTPDRAPYGSREEFLAVCGTVGLGRLAAEGDRSVLPRLRALASDPRWRVREGVAMALQRIGLAGMRGLLSEMRRWARGSDYERRAVVAGLCEPALLARRSDVVAVLEILDGVTERLARSTDRRADGFRALRKALAYGWSVALAAAPDVGRPAMERWCETEDADVRWVMRQNLEKKRSGSAGSEWVASMRARLST
jgi:hypothetical protein